MKKKLKKVKDYVKEMYGDIDEISFWDGVSLGASAAVVVMAISYNLSRAMAKRFGA